MEVEEQELSLVLRQVEDKVRRLRSGALQAMAERPSLLKKNMNDKRLVTYERKIRGELDRAHESYEAAVEKLGVSTSIEV